MTNTFRRIPRRLVPVVLALAWTLAPLSAHAQRAGSRPISLIGSPVLGADLERFSYGLLGSLEFPPGNLQVGPRITGEMMYGVMDLAPQLRLDLGGRASFAYHGVDTGNTPNASASAWLLEAVPDAKIRYAIDDMIGVYGDFGLGLALMRSSGSIGAVSNSDTSVALTIQFGAGAAYAITPRINLLGEVRFDIYTKSGTGTFIAFPTVGVEFH